MNHSSSQIRLGTILSYLNLAIGNIIPIFYTPVMLKLLGQSEYGLYTLAHSVVGYLSLLSFGIGGTIVRYLAKARADNNQQEEEKIFGLFIKIYSILALLVLLVGGIITTRVGVFFKNSITAGDVDKMRLLVLMMTVNTAISFPTSVFSSVVIANERFVFNKLISMLSTVLAPCLNLLLLYFGFGSVGMTFAGTILTIITFIGNMIYCLTVIGLKPSFAKTSGAIQREIVQFSAFIFLDELVNMLYWATDKVLIGAMMGTEAVAVYNIGATFNSIMQSLGTGVGSLFTPRVVINAAQGDNAYLDSLFHKIGRIQFYIISLILTGFAVFGRQFIVLWVGSEYRDSYVIALLVMVPLAIPLIQSIALQIIVAKNKHQFRAVLFFAVAILNIIGTVLLIPPFGIVGASIATCVAYMIGPVMLMNWYYSKTIGIDIKGFWLNIARICPVSIAMLCGGLIVTVFFNLDTWITLISGITLYTILYCILNWCFSMNTYEKEIFIKPVQKLKLKFGGQTK